MVQASWKPSVIAPLLVLSLPLGQLCAQERVDRLGDPLPEHAVARMGSLRLQHVTRVESISFAPDGKKAAVNGFWRTRVFDAATGKESKLNEPKGLQGHVSFAGTQILGVVGDRRSAGIWNLETGQKIRDIDVPCSGGRVAPNGKVAVLHYWEQESTFRFLDMETGKVTEAVRAESVGQVDHFWFSADGKRLVTVGLTGGGQSFTAWDVPAGRMMHGPPVGKHPLVWRSCLSADGTTLGNIGRQRDQVDLLDLITLKVTATFKAAAKTSLNAVAISPDGSIVAAASQSMMFLWDRKTGKEIRQIPTRGSVDQALAFSPDGKRLAAGEGNWVGIYDVTTGEPCHRFGHTYAIYSVLFAPDGKRLYSAAGYRDPSVRVWNPLNGEILEEWQGHTLGLQSMAMSSDGRWLVTSSQDRSLRIWDRDKAKELARLPDKLFGASLGFLPDGKKFVSAHWGDKKPIRIHDAATGNVERTFAFPGQGYHRVAVLGMKLWALGQESKMLESIELERGERGPQLKMPQEAWCFTVSPDGRLVAVGAQRGMVHVLDSRTGEERAQFRIRDATPREDWPTVLAFSPDGAVLAVGSYRGLVSLWELATGKERSAFSGHLNEVLCLTFSPDRKLLASAGSDRTILTWDLYGMHLGASEPPGADVLDKLWEELRQHDPAKALPAMKLLAGHPARAVALFKSKHQPPAKVEEKQLRTWIEQLDGKNFKLREEAFRELKAVIRQAEPLLQAVLAKQPTLEFRRRAERLLAERDPAASPERLRWVRAEEILRVSATPAARELLQVLQR